MAGFETQKHIPGGEMRQACGLPVFQMGISISIVHRDGIQT